MTGANGILPDHFAELILERTRAKDKSFEHFLHIFENHIAQLYYQSWQKSRPFIAYEQNAKTATQNNPLLALTLGQAGLTKRQHDHQDNIEPFLFYAGLLAQKTRPGPHLATLLSDYFETPVRIQSFDSQWTHIPKTEQAPLSRTIQKPLGQGVLLGQHIHMSQHHFVVQIGPLTYQQYQRFLPDKPTLQAMQKLIHYFVGNDYQFSIECHLQSSEVPKLYCQTNKQSFCLGWNTWLKSRSPENHPQVAKFGHSTLWQQFRNTPSPTSLP